MEKKNFWQRLLGRVVSARQQGDHDFKTKRVIVEVIRNINVSDPKKREADAWDEKFLSLIDVWHKHDESLSFANTYGHVMETYFKQIEKRKLYLDKDFPNESSSRLFQN